MEYLFILLMASYILHTNRKVLLLFKGMSQKQILEVMISEIKPSIDSSAISSIPINIRVLSVVLYASFMIVAYVAYFVLVLLYLPLPFFIPTILILVWYLCAQPSVVRAAMDIITGVKDCEESLREDKYCVIRQCIYGAHAISVILFIMVNTIRGGI